MTTFKRTTGFLALAACLLAAGCGSDDEGAPIPANVAQQLQSRLNEIHRRFDFGGGACADIQNDSEPAVEDLIASIPDDVDADVRRALSEGFDRLFVLTEDQCKKPETKTETETVTEPPPTPTVTETQTTPPETTETTPPPTETTEPPPTDTGEQAPPDQGGNAPGGEGGSGGTGQDGDATGGVQGGSGGGALVPGDEG